MTNAPFIPPKTAQKLVETFPVGTRHKAALDIAIPLVGNGIPPSAVFQTLREKFPTDVTDKELRDIVGFAESKHPKPSGNGRKTVTWQRPAAPPPAAKKRTPLEHAQWWLSGKTMTTEAFSELSKLQIPEKPTDQMRIVLELLYNGPDNLNVVCAYDWDGTKSVPKGSGRIVSRDKWIEYVTEKGVPSGNAGAWFRINPTKPQGSGSGGAVTDSDIIDFRFMLVESDVLPIETQLALLSKLKLPIVAVLMSGGKSAHAWVRVEAKNYEDYEFKTRRILTALHPFGIDQANKNPSRLSRLPGAVRKLAKIGGGEQKLLWLCPGRQAMTDADFDVFENSLLIPAIEEKPFKRLIEEAIPRYEWMVANRGKLGVPTGFPTFDSSSGGLKPGGYTLIASETGVGKTTVAFNIINAALGAKVGVSLFSLEMSREDIVDMMFSLNCRVERNKFNTGEFTESDIQSMAVGALKMQELPLWVDDNPAISVEDIRRRVLLLCSEQRIGLVVVDYAQLTLVDAPPESREQAVGAVALGLRLLSREANVPVLLLSQLNDDGKVRESRKLAHEAATVLILTRPGNDLSSNEMTLKVTKGRKIPAVPINLRFEPEHCRIVELSRISEDDVPRNRNHYPD